MTRKSGVLDLLEEEDSVMAKRGFDIEEDLLLIGVHLNMPPLLSGKFQMSKEGTCYKAHCVVTYSSQMGYRKDQEFHIFDNVHVYLLH